VSLRRGFSRRVLVKDDLSPLLVIGPHTDDAELGCGAAIARLVHLGVDVFVAALSTAEASLPPGSAPDRLREEFQAAAPALGIPADHLFVYDYPVRQLSSYRQDVLDELLRIRRRVAPKAVFVPSPHDVHQDHQVVSNEALRAFKDITLWGYELPWNHVTFSAQAFITVERTHLECKWKAMQAYRSQMELARSYFTWEFIEGLARVRGVQVKSEYAEAFEVIRIRL
jgi:LmbE family N-acetylglucosaminyl deacetylase